MAKELYEAHLSVIINRKNAALITSNKTKDGQRVRKEAIGAALNAGETGEAFALLDLYRTEAGGGKRFKKSLLKLFM